MARPAPEIAPEQLAAVASWAALDPPAIADLASAMEQIELAAGEILVRQGDAADRLFVVLEGELEAIVGTPHDPAANPMVLETPDPILATLGPGDMIGEVAIVTGSARTATVRSRTPARLAALSRAALDGIAARHPAILTILAESATRRLRRSQLATYLTDHFGWLEPEHVDELERRVEWLRLRGGEVLFSAGDPGDAAYVVLAGRLRVIGPSPGGGSRVIEEAAPGQTVGETALLTHSPRTTTVVAIRDSEVALIGGDVLAWFAENHPAATLRIMADVGERLERALAGTPQQTARGRPVTFALVAAGRTVDLERFGRDLTAAIARAGATLLLTARDAVRAVGAGPDLARPDPLDDGPPGGGLAGEPARVRLTQWLDDCEAANQYVVYLADPTWTWWTEQCARQADHLLVVADASQPPEPGEGERHLAGRWAAGEGPRQTLVLLQPPDAARPSGTARWLADRAVDQHIHLRHGSTADLERLARLLTGRAITLVLGGGGARGYAHLGVVRAFEELGIPIDMIGGTSMGALMAAGPARGWTAAETERNFERETRWLFDPTLPIVSAMSGGRIWRAIQTGYGDLDVEDLWLPFFCISTNLTRAEPVVHRAGPLALALRASSSLPGILPPVYFGGDLLVDGGLLDTLPIDVMRELNNGNRVVAVDVAPDVDLTASAPFEPRLSGWQVLRERLRPSGRGPSGRRPRYPGIVELLNRTIVAPGVFLERRLGHERRADLTLSPDVARWGTLEFNRVAPIARAGYASTFDPIRDWWSVTAPAIGLADGSDESRGAR